MLDLLNNRRSGLTLVEVMIAAALCSVMFAGLATVDLACRKLVRSQRETALASQTLDELTERLRSSNWSGLTDPQTACATLSKFESGSMTALQGSTLRLTIMPHPPVSPAPTPLVIERGANGATEIKSQPSGNFSLRSFLAVRVDSNLTWHAADTARERSREIVSVVSLGGLLK